VSPWLRYGEEGYAQRAVADARPPAASMTVTVTRRPERRHCMRRIVP
jgi:hypothetical protein